jgi:hypothetical protein
VPWELLGVTEELMAQADEARIEALKQEAIAKASHEPERN